MGPRQTQTYGTWSNSNLTQIGRLSWTLILMTVGIQTYFGLDLETKHKSAAQTMSYFRVNLYEAYKSPTKPVDHDQQSLTIQTTPNDAQRMKQ